MRKASAPNASGPGPFEMEVRDTDLQTRVSVPTAKTGLRVLIDRSAARGAKVDPKGRELGIVPAASIQVFRASRKGRGAEWARFGAAPLQVTLFKPTETKLLYFLADKASGRWVRYDDATGLKSAGFSLTCTDASIEGKPAFVLQVSQWPEGDPTYGWG